VKYLDIRNVHAEEVIEWCVLLNFVTTSDVFKDFVFKAKAKAKDLQKIFKNKKNKAKDLGPWPRPRTLLSRPRSRSRPLLFVRIMAQNGLSCADVPLRNYSLTCL